MKEEEIEKGDCGPPTPPPPQKRLFGLAARNRPSLLFLFHSLLRLTSFLSQYKKKKHVHTVNTLDFSFPILLQERRDFLWHGTCPLKLKNSLSRQGGSTRPPKRPIFEFSSTISLRQAEANQLTWTQALTSSASEELLLFQERIAGKRWLFYEPRCDQVSRKLPEHEFTLASHGQPTSMDKPCDSLCMHTNASFSMFLLKHSSSCS